MVETKNHKTLFDTGAKFQVLYENMLRLNYNPEEIDTVFISHEHKDHIGGLTGFIKKNSKPTIYLPKGLSEKKKTEIINKGGQIIETGKIQTLFENIATTGPMGTEIKEQSMIIMTTKGAVIITGCSHPGIINIIKSVSVLSNVYAVIGGFHTYKEDEEKLKEIKTAMEELDVKIVVPTHCSGEKIKKILNSSEKIKCIDGGVGFELRI